VLFAEGYVTSVSSHPLFSVLPGADAPSERDRWPTCDPPAEILAFVAQPPSSAFPLELEALGVHGPLPALNGS
jgi:hypothetical protein